MAVPRQKKSKSRRGNQRSHDALRKPAVSTCPNCDEPKRPHHACPACGWYNGRTVVEVEAE